MPSLSPRLVSTVQLQFPGPMPTNSMLGAMEVPLTVAGTVPPVPRMFCKSTGCHSTCIRKGCNRWMCKAHCIEAGGCSQPPHKGLQPPQPSTSDNMLLLPPPPSPSLQGLSIPPTPHTTSALPSLIDTMPVGAPLSQQIMIHPSLGQQVPSILRPAPLATRHAGPAFSSHMSDIFTAQMADAQRQWEKNSQRDVVRIQSQEKAKQTVFVFPFLEVSFI
jgi:hypothetical protein